METSWTWNGTQQQNLFIHRDMNASILFKTTQMYLYWTIIDTWRSVTVSDQLQDHLLKNHYTTVF